MKSDGETGAMRRKRSHRERHKASLMRLQSCTVHGGTEGSEGHGEEDEDAEASEEDLLLVKLPLASLWRP